MNAVNWLKRRVSLSSNTSPVPTTTNQHTPPPTNSSAPNHIASASVNPAHITRATPLQSRMSSQANGAPLLVAQHDIIDPTSPLSILAATSKLTTFPYGELQALNARMSMEAARLNGINPLSINGLHGMNGVNGVHGIHGLGGHENGCRQPAKQSKGRNPKKPTGSIRVSPLAKPLLPSAISSASSSDSSSQMMIPLAPIPSNLQPPPMPTGRPLAKPRNITMPLIPNPKPLTMSHSKSASLSSTQNTRSSKRLKTSHPTKTVTPIAPIPPIPPLPPLTKVTKPAPQGKSKAVPVSGKEAKKRILPVRQGHIDILDGEISLLSTPQRLDSTTPISLSDTPRPSLLRTLPQSHPRRRLDPLHPNNSLRTLHLNHNPRPKHLPQRHPSQIHRIRPSHCSPPHNRSFSTSRVRPPSRRDIPKSPSSS